MSEPREYTADEVRLKFVTYIHALIDDNAGLDEVIRLRLEGLAEAILATIDGDGYRWFILAPVPHLKDKRHKIDRGENYYPENHNANVACDIAGSLHELFHQVRPPRRARDV